MLATVVRCDAEKRHAHIRLIRHKELGSKVTAVSISTGVTPSAAPRLRGAGFSRSRFNEPAVRERARS